MKKENIKEYLLDNEETLQDIVNELNAWNGCLDNIHYQINDEEFFECFFETKGEVARAIYFGDYNYNDAFVQFNAYGNLVSCSLYEYQEELKDSIDDIVDNLIDNVDNISIYDDYLKELLENEEESEDK